eukprot:gene4123-7409_t
MFNSTSESNSTADVEDFDELLRKKKFNHSNLSSVSSVSTDVKSNVSSPSAKEKNPFKNIFSKLKKKNGSGVDSIKSSDCSISTEHSISPNTSPVTEEMKQNLNVGLKPLQTRKFEPITEFASPESDHSSPVTVYQFTSPILLSPMKTPRQPKKEIDPIIFDDTTPEKEDVKKSPIIDKTIQKTLKSPMSPIYKKAMNQSQRLWSTIEDLDSEEPALKIQKKLEKVHEEVRIVTDTVYTDGSKSPISDGTFTFDDDFDGSLSSSDEDEPIEDHPDVLKLMNKK